MAVKSDNAAAVAFLERYAPDGGWVLTCIQPDRKGIETRTFGPSTKDELNKWLELYNGQRNIYFSINEVAGSTSKKASRSEIARVRWFHVDLDPRAGENFDEERSRLLGLLTHKLPTGVPAPTAVWFSGGGYWAVWRLDEPLVIDGDLEKAEEAKLYNLQLELLFNADNCHNIDRIARLPGTINLPDAKKLKKGRTAALSKLVEFTDTVHPITAFTKATPVQTGEIGFAGGGKKVDVTRETNRIQDLTELDEWSVPDRVKIIIAQGQHPDEKKAGDNSRSAWLFDVCANLARCKVPDATIYALITDPDWGISESVLELKTNSKKYAIRQIERGKEAAIDPWLERLNTRHVVIESVGGKCRVVEEVYDPSLKRHRLTLQGFEDFRNRYMNHKIQVGVSKDGVPQFKKVGHWWLENSDRNQRHTIVFAPLEDVPESYNLWRGYGVESRPGECQKFLDHMRVNLCGGNEKYYEYLLHWLARMFQRPGEAGEVAIVLRGGRGTGKSFFAVEIGKLMGRHFMQVSNSSHLTGNFNSHLRDLVLLFADEAFYANDKKHASILKTLITEATLTIERKGVDVETAPNYIHLIMASNDMHVVPAGGDERRYFVLDVGTKHQQDTDYFGAIAQELSSGGREALLHYLLNVELDGFVVQRAPETAALREQKLLSLDPDQEWWYQKLYAGSMLRDKDGWPSTVVFDDLVDDFVQHTMRFNLTRRGSQVSLGKFLAGVCPNFTRVKMAVEVDVLMPDGWTAKKKLRKMCAIMPSLEKARTAWEKVHGVETWPDDLQGELETEEEEAF